MVKHLIVFNTPQGIGEGECRAMAHKARETLKRIPGVKDVSFGVAVSDKAAYKYLLIVDFEGEDVISFYRDHPIHTEFADSVFRPMAVDRITTDYRMVL